MRESNRAPPPHAEASLTHCGEHGVVAFGGFTGRRTASSAVHVLQPGTGAWTNMTVCGVRHIVAYRLMAQQVLSHHASLTK